MENSRGSALKPANERVRKGNEQTSSSVPKVRARTDVKSSTSLEARPATSAKIPCAWGAECKISSCDFRHPPVCRNYKSESRCIYGNNCLFRHADGQQEVEEREHSRRSCDSEFLKSPKLCNSEFRSKEVYATESSTSERERLGGTHRKILRTHLVRNSNSGKSGPSLGIIQKGDTHERNPCATKFEERTPEEPLDKKIAPAKQRGIWQKIYKLKSQ